MLAREGSVCSLDPSATGSSLLSSGRWVRIPLLLDGASTSTAARKAHNACEGPSAHEHALDGVTACDHKRAATAILEKIDCGRCTACLDTPKFGGPNIKRTSLRWF